MCISFTMITNRKTIVNKKYIIEQDHDSLLGRGNFGAVFKAHSIAFPSKHVAIKYDISDYQVLKHEAFILNYIHKHDSSLDTVPKILWYGVAECPCAMNLGNVPCLVIPHYETSLTFIIASGSKIPIQKTRQYMSEMLSILGHIHDLYVIHRDLKPDNFMMRSDGRLVLIDFGLATFYIDGITGQHVPKNKEPKTDIIGSPLYTSVFIHQGVQAARRDDLISVGYIILYILLGGKLPWLGQGDVYHQKMALVDSLGKYSSFDWLRDYLATCYTLDYEDTYLKDTISSAKISCDES